jgi:hypothetical protein
VRLRPSVIGENQNLIPKLNFSNTLRAAFCCLVLVRGRGMLTHRNGLPREDAMLGYVVLLAGAYVEKTLEESFEQCFGRSPAKVVVGSELAQIYPPEGVHPDAVMEWAKGHTAHPEWNVRV